MCGIAGLVAYPAAPDAARVAVERMRSALLHRGPDGGGVVAHPDATLGMTRLAIVDIQRGHQPMVNDDESVALVFNGEIYNAPALRSRLERRGVQFRTRSDTEVILRLYELDPERVEEELVGMWAFAIHDRRRRRVVLSRDRFGIKPLFIAFAGRSLAFASELRAFDRQLPGFAANFEIDHAAAHGMMSWSFIPETSTIYTGVERVAPATRLDIDLVTGRRQARIYWELVPSEEAARIRDLGEACRGVDALLRRAVKEHLESDVPVATFLSGGIDSSLVTAYALEASVRPIRAYAIGFHEKRFDESPYARMAAERLGVPLEVTMFDEQMARDKVVDALLAYDEPFGDSSSLATYLVSGLIARDYKVALGGDGGDEVFAGYGKYLVVKLRRPFSRTPKTRDLIADTLARVAATPTPAWVQSGYGPVLRTMRRLSRGLRGDDASVYAELTQFAPLVRTAALMRSPNSGSGAARFIDEAMTRFTRAHGNELQRTLASDLSNTLPNDMLVKVDRASMAHHLEARIPFLDHRVVEFGLGLPEQFTLGRKAGKRVLRKLHAERFGGALARREKHGFGIPVEAWLRGPFDHACERLFAKDRLDRYGVLSSNALSGGRFRDWVRTDPTIVWHAFALAAWCEVNLGAGPDSLRQLIDDSETSARQHERSVATARLDNLGSIE